MYSDFWREEFSKGSNKKRKVTTQKCIRENEKGHSDQLMNPIILIFKYEGVNLKK
jgi:hypothetical protein